MKPIKTLTQREQVAAKKPGIVFNPKLLLGLSFLIIVVYFMVFGRFFTNSGGKLGNDYSLFLPQLLDGVFWYKTNGLFEVAWFTPSFGGGLPNFPNPQSMYYSVPQFLCFVFNPVTSVRITLMLFAIIGFYGFYLLLHKIFRLSPITSLLGCTLFLFNGFYAHRMIVGHLTFHSYMLFPVFLYAVLNETKNGQNFNYKKLVRDICFGAAIIAYMVYTGALHIMPPLMLVVLIALIFYKLVNNTFKSRYSFFKLFFILMFGFILAAAKLNAGLSYLALFPRDLYPLPGIADFTDLIKLCFVSLFSVVNEQFANNITTNKIIYLEQHEYEFGLTLVPILVIVAGTIFCLFKVRIGELRTNKNLKRILGIVTILLLLCIPLLLNFYTKPWNGFLKSLPFVKNSATNIRWFSAYIPLIVLLTCVLIEKVSFLNKYKNAIVVLGIVVVLFTNMVRNRKFYHNQIYDPKIIVTAYDNLQSGKLEPGITSIGMKANLSNGEVVERNDLFTTGASQINPYEPIFGYRLETFPMGALRIGPVMESYTDGILNIKNPTGYVFPSQNNCAPGDHFTIAQKESAEKFRNYLSFPFFISTQQKIANYLTMVSFLVLVAYALFRVIVKTVPTKN